MTPLRGLRGLRAILVVCGSVVGWPLAWPASGGYGCHPAIAQLRSCLALGVALPSVVLPRAVSALLSDVLRR